MIWLGHVLRYDDERGAKQALIVYNVMHNENCNYKDGSVSGRGAGAFDYGRTTRTRIWRREDLTTAPTAAPDRGAD